MGMTFEDLTWEELCDLMCGGPEEDEDDGQYWNSKHTGYVNI